MKAARKAIRRLPHYRSSPNQRAGSAATGAVRAAGPAAAPPSPHRHGIVLAFLMIGAGVVLLPGHLGSCFISTTSGDTGGGLDCHRRVEAFFKRGARAGWYGPPRGWCGACLPPGNLVICMLSWNMICAARADCNRVLQLLGERARRRLSPEEPALCPDVLLYLFRQHFASLATFSGLKRARSQTFQAVRCWAVFGGIEWTCPCKHRANRQRSIRRCHATFGGNRHQGAGHMARGRPRPGYLSAGTKTRPFARRSKAWLSQADITGFAYSRASRSRTDLELAKAEFPANGIPFSSAGTNFPLLSWPPGFSDGPCLGLVLSMSPTEYWRDCGHHRRRSRLGWVCLPVALGMRPAFSPWARLPSGN